MIIHEILDYTTNKTTEHNNSLVLHKHIYAQFFLTNYWMRKERERRKGSKVNIQNFNTAV